MAHISEPVTFTRPGKVDEYGDYVAGEAVAEVDCVVYPAGSAAADGGDFSSDDEKLIVLAPSPTPIRVGYEALIRDQLYTVRTMAWDWSAGRRPLNNIHKPKVQVTVERAEAVDAYE